MVALTVIARQPEEVQGLLVVCYAKMRDVIPSLSKAKAKNPSTLLRTGLALRMTRHEILRPAAPE
jgi:hypothetical protein